VEALFTLFVFILPSLSCLPHSSLNFGLASVFAKLSKRGELLGFPYLRSGVTRNRVKTTNDSAVWADGINRIRATAGGHRHLYEYYLNRLFSRSWRYRGAPSTATSWFDEEGRLLVQEDNGSVENVLRARLYQTLLTSVLLNSCRRRPRTTCVLTEVIVSAVIASVTSRRRPKRAKPNWTSYILNKRR